MESLRVRTGEVKLQILDDAGDERGIFSFNPSDVKAAQAFLDMQSEFDSKQHDFETRLNNCEDDKEKISLLNEIVSYFKELIDKCYGEGSSKILFGDACSLSMFEDFFVGITPYYEKASKQRMKKYKKNSK